VHSGDKWKYRRAAERVDCEHGSNVLDGIT
jgi:hypothetical protein